MRVKVIRIIDGDTVEAEFKKSVLGVNLDATAHFRLFGIDAPEKTGDTKEAGLRSMEYLRGRIEGQKVKFKIHGKDKYGRWLATIFLEGVNINDELVQMGFAIYRSY